VATPSLDSSEFPFADCPACAKQVLTHLDFDADGVEVRRCIHCDLVIPSEHLRWAAASALRVNGYALLEARTCGNGGGCRAGGCCTRP
jgi:hypothetical protein